LLIHHTTRSKGPILRLIPLSTRNITQNTSDGALADGPVNEAAASTSATSVSTVSASSDLSPAAASEGLVTDAINNVTSHLPAVLQYGDMAALGLVGWTPAGLVRWSMEVINVSTGLPWFWTIVAGSLLWRILLVPISVKSLQNSARLLPLQPKIKVLQEEMNSVRQSGDKLALQRTALKIRKLYSDAGVNMGATALVPFVQIPVTLGMFFGVKKMCDLPVAQLTQSGLDILPNLTVADPYMILPIAVCAAVNLQISLGAAEMNLTERPEMGHLMNLFRAFSVLGVYVMASFPSGLLLSLLTTSMVTTLQSYLLQRPTIRSYLAIPYVPPEARGKLPTPVESIQFVIAKWRERLTEAKQNAVRGGKHSGKR